MIRFKMAYLDKLKEFKAIKERVENLDKNIPGWEHMSEDLLYMMYIGSLKEKSKKATKK